MPPTDRLTARLSEIIRSSGPLSVADYMRLCLTDPDDGYYTTADAIGRRGDFTTAPEISQMFGELIGLFFADYWQRIGRPAHINLVELGPGRGTLMADLLRAAGHAPGFHETIGVTFLEVSPVMRRHQAETLAASGHTPRWVDRIADLPAGGPLFLIANEFLDALPIRQVEKTEQGWCERLVDIDPPSGRLRFRLADEPGDVPDGHAAAPVGSIVETRPEAGEIMAEIAQRIAVAGGVAVIIDYGYRGPATGDTFQAVRDHQFADTLSNPGKSDLTAHVDFLPLIADSTRHGAAAWGPIHQGAFLQRLGLAERVRRLAEGQTESMNSSIRQAAERLAGPQHMGRLFKVLAVTHNDGPPPAAFDLSDREDGSEAR